MTNMARGTALNSLWGLFQRGSPASSTDARLLERFAADRDAAAFEALVARHGPMVAATCRAILRDEHDAEDAFQATFLVLAKRAGGIRAGDALAGWLHRVARRAAIESSRRAKRRRQAEAQLMATRIRTEPHDHDAEALARLHEEIDRLPERHRLPVVLCDLQGLAYDEAAARLELTLPAFRNRLARARERLRRRLIARGITAAVAAAVLAPPSLAQAAVPFSWSQAAVASAVTGAAPAGAALIAGSLLKGMFMAKIKTGAATLLGISLCASAAVLASGRFRVPTPDPHPDPRPIAVVPTPRDEPAPKPAEDDMITVRGIVVDPDGKPIPGATVRSGLGDWNKPAKTTTTGADGRFAIAVPKKYFGGREAQYLPMVPWLTASAPASGFGIGGNDPDGRGDLEAEQTIRLIADGTPIEGRVLDLEGRPVAGAVVKVRRFYFDPKSPEDLSPWLARMRSGAVRGIWQDLHDIKTEIATTTAVDGRFRITGVGHDRLASLVVTGPTIAQTEANVLTRDEPEIRTVDKAMMNATPLIVHAPRFEIAAAPTRVVEGTIRDKDTGAPIAGVQLRGMVFDDGSLLYPEGIEATTDAEGRYRLTGLARGPAYRLEIIPPEGSPYLPTSRKATPSGPTGPVPFDLALKAGAIVRGRVVEKGTGRPAKMVQVEAVVFDDTSRDDYPGAFSGYTVSVNSDAEGRFAIATLPGRGLLLVRSEDYLYRGARGYEAIPGYEGKGSGGYFNTRPHIISPAGYHAVAEIQPDLAAKPEPEPMTIEVDPGLVVSIQTIGPDGQPIDGTTVKGLGELFSTAPMPVAKAEFTVHGLDPSKPRRVVVTHEGRKLIGSVCLKGDEEGTIAVKLQPWGIVAGRVVDDEGNPVANVRLGSPTGSENRDPENSDIIPGTDWNSGLVLGDDGRFRIEGLVPGLKYGASATTNQYAGGVLFRDAITKPGEVTDLGDLKLTPYKEEK